MPESQFKKSILEAIGNTPIVQLNKVLPSIPGGNLFAKCEFMNPGGSIKDRIGKYMIEKAEAEGLLAPGGTVVESTSGNTGMGLAITAAVKGYRSIFVMPEKMSEEKRQNLRAFGARVVITPTGVEPESPLSHYKVGERLAKETPNAYYVGQYNNTTNRETHYKTTGPEIWAQTGGQIDALVAGMGTCGTISGLGKFLKEKNPKIKIIGIDPKGSILKDVFETGKHPTAQTYKIEGIGEDMIPGNFDFNVLDEIIRVEDKESMLMTRALLTKEGLFVGSSGGAAVVGAIRWMQKTKNPGRVLVILPDSGNRYLSKVFNDAWMIENSFLEKRSESTVRDMIKILQKEAKVVSAMSHETVENVVKLMQREGVSQLPVFKNDQIAGIISETALLAPLVSGALKASDSIESLIDPSFTVVSESDPVERLNDIFAAGKMALVGDLGRVKHILTKIDLIGFLSVQ